MSFPKRYHTVEEKRAAQAANQRRWRQRHPDYWQTEQLHKAAYVARDPERKRLLNAVSNNHQRAKKLGLPTEFRLSHWTKKLAVFTAACAYCGATALLDIDHLVPMAMGGPNTFANIVPACRQCNANKGRKPLDVYAAERGLDASTISARALVGDGE